MIDFLIIGGGIAGVSAAARLSHLGQVTLLEAEPVLGYHASGRSAAMFEESYGAATTVELNRASRAHHETAYGGVLSPRGLMLVGRKGQEEQTAKDADTMGLSLLSIGDALDLFPILKPETLGYAAYHADAWDIDTDRLIQSFARDARSRGADVLSGAKVTGISKGKAAWVVSTQDLEFETRNIVNAAGAWADQVARLADIKPIGLRPCRRSMARIPAPGGYDVSLWPMLLGQGETWYAKPDAGALIVSPADEDLVEPHDTWADDLTIAEGLARYEEHVTEPVNRVLTTWAGLRTFSPDRSLIIGPDPDVPDFWWFAGQGGYGFQTAPAASELLAQIAGGSSPALSQGTCAALSPARFR